MRSVLIIESYLCLIIVFSVVTRDLDERFGRPSVNFRYPEPNMRSSGVSEIPSHPAQDF